MGNIIMIFGLRAEAWILWIACNAARCHGKG